MTTDLGVPHATSAASPPAATAPPTPPGVGRREGWRRRAPLLPALVFLIVVTQLPFVATLVISFRRWNALDPHDTGWAGIDNYRQVFTDPELRSSVLTTIVLTVSVVLVSLVLGLVAALALDKRFPGRGVARTLMIAPFLVVPVAAALLFKHGFYNPVYGVLNGLLTGLWHLFGATDPPQPDWLAAHPSIMVEGELVWQWTPFMMLILLAGLQSRDRETVESALVDGASGWHIFRYLTLPHLRRYLELGTVLGAIFIVQNFDSVFTITSGGLGTANLPYTIYETFYAAHDYGLASAQGVVVVAGSLVLASFGLRVVSSLLSEEGR